MSHLALRIAVSSLLCCLATAQRSISQELHPVPGQIQRAGTYDVAGRRWVSPSRSAAARSGTMIVYDNTCTWTGGSFYVETGSCEDYFGDGRIPGGTGSGGNPLGSTTDNLINYFEIAYCTAVLTGAVDIKIGFYDNLGGPCLGGIAPTPPPLSSQANCYFDLGAGAGFPLPGATTPGVVACTIVGFSNVGCCLQSDGDGVFDNLAALDNFAWSFQMDNPSGTPPNGVYLAGEPGTSPVGGCTYNIPCGTDANYGVPCGHGLGQNDSFWVNVDNDLASNGTNTGVSCVGATATGTDCYWFGGHPGNPYAGLYLKLGSAGACGGCDNNPTNYCTPSTSTFGCVGTLSLSGIACAGGGAMPALIVGTGVSGKSKGRIFFGLQPTSLPWANSGFLCVKAPHKNGPPQSSGGALFQCNGVISADINAILAAGGGTLLGTPMFAGVTLYAQGLYRESFFGSKKDRLTDAISFTLCP